MNFEKSLLSEMLLDDRTSSGMVSLTRPGVLALGEAEVEGTCPDGL